MLGENAKMVEQTYFTFLRSARNFREFASAPKEIQDTGLSYSEAREACQEFKQNRTEKQIEEGTMLEFESE